MPLSVPPISSAATVGIDRKTFQTALTWPVIACCWPIVEVSPFCALATKRKDAVSRMTATSSVDIGHRGKCEEHVEQGAHAAKQQHESAIPHPERIPHVADESEHKGQIERDGGHEPEIGDLVRGQDAVCS